MNAILASDPKKAPWSHLKGFFSLEGLPYAGKSSLLSALVARGLSRLGELAEFHRNGANFPAAANNTAEALVTDRWFVNAEILRLQRLRSMDASVVVADRCIVSSLAYCYARFKVFGIGDLERECRMIEHAIDDGTIAVPPLFYLSIPLPKYLERRERYFEERCQKLGRGAVQNVTMFEREEEFYGAQREYYEGLAARLPGCVFVLNGLLSTETLATQTCCMLKTLLQKPLDYYLTRTGRVYAQ